MWNEIKYFIDRITEFLGLANVDFFHVLFSLFLAIVIAFMISQIYKFTHRGLNYELTFMSTLVVLSPIIAVVMLFIRGDLVLSIGLIGSISIIRFRTPIKDTRDMVFLFWVISVGLGCGTYNWNVVILSTFIISVVIILLHYLKYGQTKAIDYVLVISGTKTLKNHEVNQVLKNFTKEVRVRSQETEDDFWEIVLEVEFKELTEEIVGNLHNQLNNIIGVKKVSLLAPQIALPV